VGRLSCSWATYPALSAAQPWRLAVARFAPVCLAHQATWEKSRGLRRSPHEATMGHMATRLGIAPASAVTGGSGVSRGTAATDVVVDAG
jgi:hypothetical protein